MTFRVGMKVVCVDVSGDGQWCGDVPRKGEVYTVAGVVETVLGRGLLLHEIKNDPEFSHSYAAWRFRPVVSPKREVSFTTGAPEDSERWDNRVKKSPQKAVTALHS